MSRSNKNKPQTRVSNESQNTKNLAIKIDELQVTNKISNEELEELEDEKIPLDLQVKGIEQIYQQTTKIQKLLDAKKIEYSKKIASFDEEIKKHEDATKEYDIKKLELDERIKKYDDELREINKLRVGNFSNIIDKHIIDKYSESIDEQKILVMKEIEKLKFHQSDYLELISNKEQELLNIKEQLFREKIKLQKEFQNNFEIKETEFQELGRRLEKEKRQLQLDREDFSEEKEYLYKKTRKLVEEEIQTLNNTIILLEQKNTFLLQKVEECENLRRCFGGKDPKRVIDELTAAKDEVYLLQSKLELSPDILDVHELKQLRREKVDWKSDLSEAHATINDYKQRWEKEQLSIGEKETLEFQKEELKKRIELQQIALDEFQKVLEKSNATETFSACIKMDEECDYEDKLDYENGYFCEEWVRIIQQKFAKREVPLYYDKNIIRSFVAGLAMSRLNILQGISGTGKTSLPKAFAEAVGGYWQTIEVQSGWKDRQDLIGYYNTFEKKFYESDFLKALYMANTPKYRKKIFFIILDEMNLSHPEHYFADILSLMEASFDEQKLKISDEINGKPKYMQNEIGTFKLKIPDNVWFIGTANHDETTLQFAPKTYDRANVMEMPKNHNIIQISSDVDFDYVLTDNESLLENFINHKYKYDTNKINSYLSKDKNFKSICNNLGIGWGNRLEKQLLKFIPVFMSLGGSEADAIDHIISTKILRNIQGRYDLQEAILKKMKDELENGFVNVFGDLPVKCLDIVEEELTKK